MASKSKNDDVIPSAYKYAWSNDSSEPLDEFLKKFRPSMVQNDGTKHWIWVTRSRPEREDSGESEAADEARAILKTLTERVEEIKNDDSIPVRSSKKTGAKSKKEIREAAQAEATKKLGEVSVKHGYVSGKWLMFASAEKVDHIWSSIATSLVSGPLASTSAYSAKVSTSPQEETANYQHIICLYMPDVYDKAKVLEVMKVLLSNHGISLSGVKSNLYTILGIDSKHPSGIQSTVWKNSAVLPDVEAKALKDAYFADLATKKVQSTEQPEKVAEAQETPEKAEDATTAIEKKPEASSDKAKAKAKPKLKKKIGKEADPFASSSEEDNAPAKKPAPKAKSKQSAPSAKKRKESPSDEEDEDDTQSKTKRHKVGR